MRCYGGIVWGSLNPAVKRKVRDLEIELGKTAYIMWPFTNPKGDIFLFARYGKKKDPDNTIVTIAHRDRRVIGGWNTFGV